MKNKSNKVILAGEVKTTPESYTYLGEDFYEFQLAVKRESGTEDIIPVNISQYLVNKLSVGDKVCLIGQIRTYNKQIDGKNRLIIVFFAQEIKEYVKDENQVELVGYFCKKPIHRTTPLGRDICDILLAVNRERGKSDYIPCIVWGRTAAHIGTLDVGVKVSLQGRLQSREYDKWNDEEKGYYTCIAYEVSANRIKEEIEEVEL